jgi:lipopolysaccharide assembly outer membrane protein LptD (OstA)
MKNLIQFFLFSLLIIIIIFFYKSYFSEDNEAKKIEEIKKILPSEKVMLSGKIKNKTQNNVITNLKYNVELLEGGKYEIKASSSEITFENGVEIVFMKKVVAIFTDKKNNKIHVTSDYAKFNSLNYNTFFEKNIKILNEKNVITSNKLDFNFNQDNIVIYDNVKLTSLNGIVKTENIKINLITKNIEIFMNNPKNKVKVITN